MLHATVEAVSSRSAPEPEVHDERAVHRQGRCALEPPRHREYLSGPVGYVGFASHVTGEVQRARAEVRAKPWDYSGNAEGSG